MAATFEQGKDQIAKLTDYFRTNQSAFHAPGVKEAHVLQGRTPPCRDRAHAGCAVT